MYERVYFSIAALLWSFFFFVIWGVGSHGHFNFSTVVKEDVAVVIGFYSGIVVFLFIWLKYFIQDINKKHSA